MPIADVIEVSEGFDELAELTGKVFTAIIANVSKVRSVRARGSRGPRFGRPRVVPPAQSFVVDVADDPTELARSCARKIVDTITTDADGELWRGAVELVGDDDDKGKPTIIDTVDAKLSAGAPTPKPTKDDEVVATIGALRETIKGLGEAFVRVANAKSDEVGAYTKMVIEVADSVRRQSVQDGKWQWKMHKETEETERVREEARERAQKSANFWSAFEVWAEEWKDVAKIWSEYFASGSGKKMPDRPTQAEIDSVFDWPGASVDGVPFGEVFDPIRAIVSELIAETDVKRRLAMAKDVLTKAVNALSETARNTMTMRMVQVLGPDRTREVSAWLTLPLG